MCKKTSGRKKCKIQHKDGKRNSVGFHQKRWQKKICKSWWIPLLPDCEDGEIVVGMTVYLATERATKSFLVYEDSIKSWSQYNWTIAVGRKNTPIKTMQSPRALGLLPRKMGGVLMRISGRCSIQCNIASIQNKYKKKQLLILTLYFDDLYFV